MQQVVEYEEKARSHQALTYDHASASGTWAKSELPSGQALRAPSPVFKELDESAIEEEYTQLEEEMVSRELRFRSRAAWHPGFAFAPSDPLLLTIRPIHCIIYTCK